MNSFAIWLMDSECCCECGAVLDPIDSTLCNDCQQDQWYDEDQDYADGWFGDWDIPEEERGKP